jgi:hypothetical protein
LKIDQNRFVPGAEEYIMEEWLGIAPDETLKMKIWSLPSKRKKRFNQQYAVELIKPEMRIMLLIQQKMDAKKIRRRTRKTFIYNHTNRENWILR